MDGRRVDWSTTAFQRNFITLALDILNKRDHLSRSRIIPPKRPLESRELRQAQPTSPFQAPRPAPKLQQVQRLDRLGQPAQKESRRE
ncbi:hypothetical protein D8674_036755 [Pyrus ussuriensis x Pyrus communis]|uniref:Uncharacterized protein n=1 Tax=Pyrus ussuriensis x Pyrus communis TaxID=2448454 RepID=A0A5N5EUM7_9ROSA|nr:hypothetical protein D8674_036755 [Pyrus ussuriensis x Pyrus communis]